MVSGRMHSTLGYKIGKIQFVKIELHFIKKKNLKLSLHF